MVVYACAVEPKDNYKLLVTFENGEKKMFDCSVLLEKNIYKPLKSKSFFDTVKLEYGTAVWDSRIDISPEYLYENGVKL